VLESPIRLPSKRLPPTGVGIRWHSIDMGMGMGMGMAWASTKSHANRIAAPLHQDA